MPTLRFAQLLVDRAIAVVAQERLTDRVHTANEETASLEAGLESNRQIGMAMGMPMTLNKVDAEAAFATLREESQSTNWWHRWSVRAAAMMKFTVKQSARPSAG